MRAMFHVDNCYLLPNVEVVGRVCRTHHVSHTAFRGFGGPQGMVVIEEIIDRVARTLGLAAARWCASATSTARATARTTARRCATPSASRASGASSSRAASFDERCARGRRASTPRTPHRKRGLAITPGEVRHLVHHRLLQPGRRAGADLQGRQRAGEPRRHRDGPGPAHQDAADRGATRSGLPLEQHPRDADAHRQGAEHLGHRGLQRLRPERRGGARRLRDAARAAAPRSPAACFGVRAGAGARSRTARCYAAARAGARRPFARGRRAGLPRARAAVRHRLLPHARHLHFDRADGQRQAVSLLRLRRRRERGRGRRLHRPVRAAARGHPARRRRLALAADRPRPDRGRLRAGRGLAHHARSWSGRRSGALGDAAAPRPTSCPTLGECPPIFSVALLDARRASPAWSTAARRWASRR